MENETFFSIKRAIPRVTAASLTLIGSACGEPKSVTIESVSEIACDAFIRCDPDKFDNSFSSFRDCESKVEYTIESAMISYDSSSSCEQAVLEYYDCYFSEYYVACNGARAKVDCEHMSDRINEACD